MKDIVFRPPAGAGRREAEMKRAVEFHLRRLTLSGNEFGTFQKLECFREPWVNKCIARHYHAHDLSGRPAH